MDTSEVMAAIDEEIDRLLHARKILFSGGSLQTGRRRHKLSAKARARIAAAQKKRWAQKKKSVPKR